MFIFLMLSSKLMVQKITLILGFALWVITTREAREDGGVTMMMRWLVGLMAMIMILARRRVHDERGSLILSPATHDTSFLMVVHDCPG